MKRKLRILEINKLYHPWIGGVETVAQDIAEGLKDQVDMTVLACQPSGPRAEECINGVKVIKETSFGMFFSMPLSLSFFHALRSASAHADILQLHVPFPLGDLACLASGFKGKIVVWWHFSVTRQKKLKIFYLPILKRLLRRADLIVTATQNHVEEAPELWPHRSKCVVIPYGIRIDEYLRQPADAILTRRLHHPGSVKILFAGRLVYYKGVEVLLDAFSGIVGAELFIIGTGALEEKLKTTCADGGMADRVHFLGRLEVPEMRAAFRDCDFFVFPSVVNTEAFGIVQLEAMVYGKPVINTDLPTGVPTVSLDGVTGYTVTAGDPASLAAAMQRLVDEPETLRRMGENAAKRVRDTYSMEGMLEALMSQYERLADS